jgi:hypothetical protein
MTCRHGGLNGRLCNNSTIRKHPSTRAAAAAAEACKRYGLTDASIAISPVQDMHCRCCAAGSTSTT